MSYTGDEFARARAARRERLGQAHRPAGSRAFDLEIQQDRERKAEEQIARMKRGASDPPAGEPWRQTLAERW